MENWCTILSKWMALTVGSWQNDGCLYESSSAVQFSQCSSIVLWAWSRQDVRHSQGELHRISSILCSLLCVCVLWPWFMVACRSSEIMNTVNVQCKGWEFDFCYRLIQRTNSPLQFNQVCLNLFYINISAWSLEKRPILFMLRKDKNDFWICPSMDSAPKVNWCFLAPHPILSPGFEKICSLVFV